MLRILLGEDHDIVRRGVRDLVAAQPGWEVCAEERDGPAALAAALRLGPDVAVLDISLPGMDGISLTRRLKDERPEVNVLLFTMHDDDETVRSGLAAGARGYVLKSDSAGQLVAAIAAVGRRGTFFSASVAEMLLAAGMQRRKSRRDSFTARELDVARLVTLGLTNREIARRLGLGAKTAETHRAAAMRKAGARTAAELTRFVVKHGLDEA